MKAAICTKYGPPEVVELREVATPMPKDDEVLIRIHAASVTSGDWRIRSAQVPAGFGPIVKLVFGINGPRQPILGSELSGVIERVGKNVRDFKAGDEVFAFPGLKSQCHAEYRCIAETANVVPKPKKLSHVQAAAISFGGTTALYFLRDAAKVKPGERVLILGASGAVGSSAVQIAKHLGAHVTGVCSGSNVAVVTNLGADVVIDYTQQDFTKAAIQYDIVFDTVGATTFANCKSVLSQGGRFLMAVAGLAETLGSIWPRSNGHRIKAGSGPERRADLILLAEWAEAGIYTPLIDCTLPFESIVAAYKRVDSGRKRGSVVLTMT